MTRPRPVGRRWTDAEAPMQACEHRGGRHHSERKHFKPGRPLDITGGLFNSFPRLFTPRPPDARRHDSRSAAGAFWLGRLPGPPATAENGSEGRQAARNMHVKFGLGGLIPRPSGFFHPNVWPSHHPAAVVIFLIWADPNGNQTQSDLAEKLRAGASAQRLRNQLVGFGL